MGSLKIVHEKYADKNNLKEVRARHWKEFQQAVLQNPQIEANLVRVSAVISAICTPQDNCLFFVLPSSDLLASASQARGTCTLWLQQQQRVQCQLQVPTHIVYT